MTLDLWLSAATQGLPPEVVHRVRAEYTAHVAESGLPEAEAVAALGQPKTVRRALEREHFTRAEEDALWASRAYRTAEVRSVPRLLLELPFALALGFLVPLLRGWDGTFAWTSYGAYARGCCASRDWNG